MRVLTTTAPHAAYRIDVGQRGVTFVERPIPRGRGRWKWTDGFLPVRRNDIDLIHATNSLPLPARRPYVVSFEDFMPRVPEDRYIGLLERFLVRRLHSEQCKALLPWSEYARRQSSVQLAKYARSSEILGKMQVVPPPVQLRAHQPKRPSVEKIKLIFVGADWIRKGCPALLRAHRLLRESGVPVETTIVSSLRSGPGKYVGSPSKEWESAQRALVDEPGIRHFTSVRNTDVLELLGSSDYLVLPTLHDTYGFAAAEALGCGTPVIATDTCAMPDIITHGETGFFVPLESDGVVGKWPWVYRSDHPSYRDVFERTVAALAEGLVETVTMAFDNRARYTDMSSAAIVDVRKRMSFDAIRERLEQIYETAVASA